jgi:thiosulfate/3-mercaptopyruvate sulfurtransferase
LSAPLISIAELASRLGEPGLRILDASWHLDRRDARSAFVEVHIPGAVFFDIDDIADPASSLPHMLPSAELFAAKVGALGVSNANAVVVYDYQAILSAARAWWMFRAMGFDNVRVLDGGLGKWLGEGRPTATGNPSLRQAPFVARFRPELVRSAEAVRDALTQGVQIVDARPAARFRGEAPEPRPGLRAGHMPNARNLPAPAMFAADGTLRPADELRTLFAEAGIDPRAPSIASCGSGIAATDTALAMAVLGNWDVAVYDGSWTEWGGRLDLPVVTGNAA